MADIEKSIVVDVPVRIAYDQWTQFESFPKFMEGVKEVRQLDDKHLYWHADVGGKDLTWNAEITEQLPDRRIAWHATSGARNAGRVTFQPEGSDKTRVTLLLDYDPKGMTENVGSAVGVPSRTIEGDLKRFKDYIESRQQPTGGWRGEIHGGRETKRGGEEKPSH